MSAPRAAATPDGTGHTATPGTGIPDAAARATPSAQPAEPARPATAPAAAAGGSGAPGGSTPPGAAKAAGPEPSTRRLRVVLIAVIALYLIAETALAPFLPQLFTQLYAIDDPGATGLYLWTCRVVGLAALPLWGLAARRYALHRLVLTGLCASAACDLALGLAPTYAAFTALSAASVAANCALLLAYPALIAEHSRHAGAGHPGSDHARLAAVTAIVAVFHLASVAATLTGAGVLALPDPRLGISAFALLDLLLAALLLRTLRHLPPPAPGERPATPRRGTTWLLLLAQAAVIGVAFDFAVSASRPFFTELAHHLGSGPGLAAALFLLPSLTALAVLPAARRCHALLGARLLPAALALTAAGLASQYLADGLPALAAGRALFGAGLGLAQIAVELRMFRATGTAGPAFTAVETVRSAGLVAAPLIAAATASRDLALPLGVAAAALLGAALVSLVRGRTGTGSGTGTGTAVHDTPAAHEPEEARS
ncbi:hypothetical protein V1J52_20380 [Streptomyces sp. TRM 70351]|uniref:hypothetical protein n=1 Tax=Streptomyces sp. TRM 70351 TaxID=3116552 RepID=UPI002E7B015A|nr:hypothetical protein [Streptomyces sp. TRM 70351]MEE1930514.1 hypothetical protein [Streptomyces sp. TRM 70351]